MFLKIKLLKLIYVILIQNYYHIILTNYYQKINIIFILASISLKFIQFFLSLSFYKIL